MALSGNEGSYKFVARSESVDLRTVVNDMRATLSVKGGGNSGMVPGSIFSGIDEIKSFFLK